MTIAESVVLSTSSHSLELSCTLKLPKKLLKVALTVALPAFLIILAAVALTEEKLETLMESLEMPSLIGASSIGACAALLFKILMKSTIEKPTT